jgi:hypothetical protein
MGTNGFYADVELMGNLFIQQTICKQNKYLLLPDRELSQQFLFHMRELCTGTNIGRETKGINHPLVVILLSKNLVEGFGTGVDLKLLINVSDMGAYRFCAHEKLVCNFFVA